MTRTSDHHHRTLLLAFLLPLLALPSASAPAQNNPVENLSKPYQKWLDEDCRYIITDQERADFYQLATNQDRDRFVEEFWERRNPSPGSEENTFKADYQRIAYANERFATTFPDGRPTRVASTSPTVHPMSVSNIGAAPWLVR